MRDTLENKCLVLLKNVKIMKGKNSKFIEKHRKKFVIKGF